MEIYHEDGLDFRKDERGDFVINPNERALRQIKDTNIRNVELNAALGVVPGNGSLYFLKEFDFIEGISIVGNHKMDIKSIHYLSNLRLLSLPGEFDEAVDFSHFEKLNYCQIAWNSKIKNIQNLKFLNTLFLYKYKKQDLAEFRELTSLKKFCILQSTIRSLNGLENFALLEYLELAYLRNLESLNGIQSLKKLRNLDLTNTPKIDSLTSLESLKCLEALSIYGARNIQSISSLKDLKELKFIHISGNTNVIDGDMSAMLGREDASIGTRKHYSHTSEEIDKFNGTVRHKQTWDY